MLFEEVETMVRRASELKSLDELRLSARVCAYLRKKGTPLHELVSIGRQDAIILERYPDDSYSFDGWPKWREELVTALRNTEFVRPDLSRTRSVMRLYGVIWNKQHVFFECENLESCGAYETVGRVTDEQFDGLMRVLAMLTPVEEKILILRFGLEDGKECTREEIGKEIGITGERVRQCEARALRKLRTPTFRNQLPEMFGYEGSIALFLRKRPRLD